MSAHPPPNPILTQSGFRRVSVRGCELRYYRTGAGAPIVLLHPLRAQLEYFAPLLGHLDGTHCPVTPGLFARCACTGKAGSPPASSTR